MKKTFLFAAVSSAALLVSACGDNAADVAEGDTVVSTDETTEVATTEECTQDTMMAKAQELGTKMQALAGDPEAMQKMTSKMQEVQEKMQAGAADGSFGIAEACAVYDEMLAE